MKKRDSNEIVELIRGHAETALSRLTAAALECAVRELIRIDDASARSANLGTNLAEVLERFTRYVGHNFTYLISGKARHLEPGDYPALSVVSDDFMEAANAMEGMVAYARNVNIRSLLALAARLDALIVTTHVDETNNPLDPDKVAGAFTDALGPLGIGPRQSLVFYRCFNQSVLRELERVVDRANEICLSHNVLPDLDIDARGREAMKKHRGNFRPSRPALERVFSRPDQLQDADSRSDSATLYATIRSLLRNPAAAAGKSNRLPRTGQTSEVVVPAAAIMARNFPGSLATELGLIPLSLRPGMAVGNKKLVELPVTELAGQLDYVQQCLVEQINQDGRLDIDHRQVTEYLGQALENSAKSGSVNAIDAESFEKVLTVALLYEAFGRDVSLVRPIRELIVATQVVMMKLALFDDSLFENENHPVRQLLNAIAGAGVGWTDIDKLRSDATYVKLESLVVRLVTEFDGRTELLQELLGQLHRDDDDDNIDARLLAGKSGQSGSEYRQRIAEVNDYVSARIAERIHEPLDPDVAELVHRYFHRFLVSVVQRDGQGSHAWVLVIKILDLLLWTVRSRKTDSDRQRLRRLNPQLLANLTKMLHLVGLDSVGSGEVLERFQAAQARSFGDGPDHGERPAQFVSAKIPDPDARPAAETASSAGSNGSSPGSREDYLAQVDRLPIGTWVRFRMDGRRFIYCSLAARLDDSNRLVFVNRQGVKVVEKSHSGLASEFRDSTVQLVGEWPLFERGLERVIASLRERSALMVA